MSADVFNLCGTHMAVIAWDRTGPKPLTLLAGLVPVATFYAGREDIAARVLELLERHGLADVPDTCAEVDA